MLARPLHSVGGIEDPRIPQQEDTMAEDLRAEARPHPDEVIERRDTGLRILLTLLFLLIAAVSQVPFPFSDFPGPVEPGGWRGGSPEADALGLANLEDSRRPGV
jgi:hypothetical protein